MFDYDSVEFNTYIEIIKNNVKSPFSREVLNDIKSENDLEIITHKQNLLRESIDCTSHYEFPLYGDEKTFLIYLKINEHACFLINTDFLIIKSFLKNIKEIKNIFKDEKKYEELSKLIESMNTFDDFYNDLERIFDDEGYIKDSANDNIYKIRQQMYKLRKEINSTLNKVIYTPSSKYFINDNIVTERYNRYLILCKPNFRNYIDGLVQDVSVSGQTYYVEPIEVVELNNSYRESKKAEEDEIRRIIEELNSEFKKNKEVFINSINVYKKFVYYVELGKFYSSMPIYFPIFSDKILLKNIHHPIIYFNKRDESVSIDFTMDEGVSLSIITGPNAGGKTAAIKLVGLCCLIAKCGLPLTCEYAEMINFENLLSDIGDKQSILMDLSSFTAHISNLKDILKYSTKNTLIIMDEPGSNTEPRKGAALSLSIIGELVARGCKVLVATHYEEIKNEGIFNKKARVFAVDYDYDSNKPKYKLIEGVSGDSSPFIIARKYGLPESILRKAEDIYNEIYSDREKSLDEIKEMQLSLQKKLNFVDDLLVNLKRLYEYINRKWESFDKLLKEREEKVLLEAQYYLNKAKNFYKKSKKINKNEIDVTSTQIESRIDTLKEFHEYPKDIKIGDKIFLSKIGKIAEIIDLRDEEAIINLDNKKINLDKRDLIGKIVKKEKRDVKIVKGDFNKHIPEINIIGKRVDEACELLDEFIDKMILDGVSTFHIIHGRGTGALRKGVHEYLRMSRFIKNYRLAHIDEGGDAITIVEI
jgi:DNA mismatch repair protein MutS2